MKKPARLYHFTKTETALRYILPKEIISKESRLRMNNVGLMNDPKENLSYVTNTDESIINPIDGYKIKGDSYLIANHIRNESQVLCFSIDKEKDGSNINGYQLQRMWSQYGENCSGICIVLDYEKFIVSNKQQIEEYGIKDDYVSYNNRNYLNIPSRKHGKKVNKNGKDNSISIKDLWEDSKKDEKFIKERFFTKNMDWEGESEYRFFAFSNMNENIFLDISSSIEMIILGFNFSKHYLPSLEYLVDKEKIYLLDMGSDEQFRLKTI